jgi:para-aminobenzoate synthetase component 1
LSSTDAHRPRDASAAPHPAELLARWPKDEPLAALVSGGELGTHNGWSIFARPRETVVIPASASADEARSILAGALARTPRIGTSGTALTRADSTASVEQAARTSPFDGGWIVALGYGLGSVFEPAAPARLPRDAPLAVLHWCEDAWIFDHASGALTAVGSPPKLADLAPIAPTFAPPSPSDRAWELSALSCEPSDAAFAANVARTVEYIRAGDAFQANIARRFSAEFRGCPRAFAHAAIRANNAWFGAAIDLPNDGKLVSMSPESFLRVYPDGTIVTRPIKGTRPTSTDPRELLESDKDAAELAMIVDLMRNDLGRVAEIGSVEVTTARVLETHVTVHHGVAEVRARLAPQVDWLELLAAARRKSARCRSSMNSSRRRAGSTAARSDSSRARGMRRSTWRFEPRNSAPNPPTASARSPTTPVAGSSSRVHLPTRLQRPTRRRGRSHVLSRLQNSTSWGRSCRVSTGSTNPARPTNGR